MLQTLQVVNKLQQKMPRTKASRRSAAAKIHFAKMRASACPAVQAEKSPAVDAALREEMGPEVPAVPVGSQSSSPEVVLPLSKKAIGYPAHIVVQDLYIPGIEKSLTCSIPGIEKTLTSPTHTISEAMISPTATLSKPMLSQTPAPLRCDTNVAVRDPVMQALRGSFHQGHPMFGVNANKQCVANSVTAILMSKIKNVLTWTTADLDHVLLNGDELYSSIKGGGRIHDPSGYLFVGDLPTTHTLQQNSPASPLYNIAQLGLQRLSTTVHNQTCSGHNIIKMSP
ncbi:uncharacterized protein LOC143521483 isoform X3 [Brachyhypopomus gauderio]|uniref:uncharacterized protein LOC143521483 isoform X3 n=1 Tax=Brachyhypopomus gauderio TaxID=698409 RepID=UPI00404343C3